MVNRGGITFAFPGAGGGRSHPGAGHAGVRRVPGGLRSGPTLLKVEALDNVVPTTAQTGLYLEFRRLLDRAVRWFTSCPTTLDISAEIERFAGTIGDLGPRVATLLRGDEKKRLERKVAEFGKAACPTTSRSGTRHPCSTGTRCSTSSTSPPTRVVEPDAVAPLYYLVSSASASTPCSARSPACRATTGGTPWLAACDDLYSVLESLTRAVIETGGTGTEPAEQWEGFWEDANKDALDAQHHGARGDPPARQPQHRRPLGGPADAALGHPLGGCHLTPAA